MFNGVQDTIFGDWDSIPLDSKDPLRSYDVPQNVYDVDRLGCTRLL